MINDRPRAICSPVCRVCLEIFKMADIHEHASHVDSFFVIDSVVRHEFLH